MGNGPQQPKWLQRPETDYERWLREQDEDFKPADHPFYGPNMEGTNDLDDSGTNKDGEKPMLNSHQEPTHHGHFIEQHNMPIASSTSRLHRLSNYSIICSLLLSIVLTVVIIKLAIAFRRGGRRVGAILLSENFGNR